MIDSALFEPIRDSLLLQGLDETDLQRLAVACDMRQVAEGTTVFIENMPGESLFLIRQGVIRITRMFAEGDEQALVTLGCGDLFGEMALIDGLPRGATARVVDAAELISLKRKDFETLGQDCPALALKLVMNIVRHFSRRIRQSQDEYRDMLIWSIQGDRAPSERGA